jgi:hypothetical protein
VNDPINQNDYSGQGFWGNVLKVATVVVVAVVVVAVVAAAFVLLAPAEAVVFVGAALTVAATKIGSFIQGASTIGGGAAKVLSKAGGSSAGTTVTKGTDATSRAMQEVPKPGLTTISNSGSTISNQAPSLANNPLANTTYTSKVVGQMAKDAHHGFPLEVDNFGAYGQLSPIKGGDGIQRIFLRIDGSLNGKDGFFEYLLEPNGSVNHRLFKEY